MGMSVRWAVTFALALLSGCVSEGAAQKNPATSAEAAAPPIPREWRSRIELIRSFDLPTGCGGATPINFMVLSAGPAPPARQSFVLRCDEWGSGQGSRSIHWLDAASGRDIGFAQQPPAVGDNDKVVARAGGARALMMSNDRRDLVLVGPDNTVERIAIPPLPGAARLSEFISEVSPSGRYVVLGAEENSAFGPERSGAGILDIESGRWVWTHPALVNEQVAEREVFAFIRESGDGLKIYFTRYGHDCIPPAVTCANGRLVEIDARTNVVREMPIPAGDFRPNLAEYYGPDRVLLYLVPSQVPSQSLEIPEVALVDLRSMRVVWTGRRDAAPP